MQEETTHASQAYLLLFVAVLQHYLRIVVPDLPAPLAPFLATPNRGTFVTPDHLRRRAVPAPASETKPTLLANPDASPPWTADVKRCVTVSLDAAALLTPSAMVDAVLRLGDIVVLTGLPSDPFKVRATAPISGADVAAPSDAHAMCDACTRDDGAPGNHGTDAQYQFQRLATSTDLVQVHLVLQLIARFPSLFNAEDRTALLVQLVGLVVSAHRCARRPFRVPPTKERCRRFSLSRRSRPPTLAGRPGTTAPKTNVSWSRSGCWRRRRPWAYARTPWRRFGSTFTRPRSTASA